MPTTKERVEALEERMKAQEGTTRQLAAGLQALGQRMDRAAEVVQSTHKQMEALGKRMDQLASRMDELVQAVDRRLGAMEKALAAAGVMQPGNPEDARRRRLHASLREEARRLGLGPRKLARAIGVPYQTVADWLQGNAIPRASAHLDAIINWLESAQFSAPEEE